MEKELEKCSKRAKLVKKLRTERAWSQSQLAEVASISSRTVQRVEKDGTASFETLMSIASAFDIDVKELTYAKISELHNKPQKSLYLMPRISTGNQLSKIVSGADKFQVEHDDSDDPRATGAMKGVIGLLSEDIERMLKSNPDEKFQIEREVSQELDGIEKFGFYIFGILRKVPDENDREVNLCTIFMSHSKSPKIVKNKDSRMMVPAVLTEVLK